MKFSRLLGATALLSTIVLPGMAMAQNTGSGTTGTQNCTPGSTLPECQNPTTSPSGQTQGEGDTDAQADSAGKQGRADSLNGTNDATTAGDVTVTGSRIRSPNVSSNIPITSIGGDAIFQTADQNVGELLNELPQLRSTFAQQNPGGGIGIAGLSLLDLRGLGTQRTLVLVNGRRHVPADILNNAVSPDVSSIPNDLIERIDIVTQGSSAVYGSDAIAGVVNFVLRRQFDGLQLRASAGTTEAGFGGNQYLSAMAGKNFAEGRGNITLHGEYSNQSRVFGSDVPSFRRVDGLFTVDADSAGLPSNSDGSPDAVFLRDIRQTTTNPFGLIAIPQPAVNVGNSPCGNATSPNNGGPNSLGTPFNCNYIFDSNGNLAFQTGSRFGTSQFGTFQGGNGSTGREGQTLSILPSLERYNFNVLAHFEFSKAFEVFFEGKYNRVKARGNNAGPSFIQTSQGQQGNTGDGRERPRLDNPYLTDAQRATLTNAILTGGFEPRLTSRVPLTPATRAQAAAGTLRFDLSRNLIDVGLRDEDFKRDTYRAVAGVRGTFNDDWGYEISGNYGRFDQSQVTSGFIDRQRFSLAIDAGRNPATGAIQCRSQFDPTAAIALQRTDAVSVAIAPQNRARLAADIAACQPYNPFGAADNTAAINYFSSTFRAKASLEQVIGQAFVSGDLSQLFELPGGPVRFSVGGEYRREKARYEQDAFTTQGFNNGVSIPLFSPPAFEVKEAFGEIQIPLLKDKPFFEELTFSGAARVSDYKGSVGTVYAYNAGATWSPIRDIRFRASYARAVRAPNVSETGFPLVPNFSNGIIDPCDVVAINTGTANRRANCITQVGTGNLANLTSRAYALPIVSGSNPNLSEETSDSYTAGVVLQPRYIRGLAITVDYFNIRVNNIIASVGAQQILNNCVDQPTLNNVFCGAFTRFAGPGTGPNGELPGAVLGNSLIVAPLNFAKRIREGLDVNVQYRTKIGENARFTTNFIYTHGFNSSNFEDATNPKFENRILEELGDPKDEFRLDTDLGVGAFTFGYRLRLIGAQYTSLYENFNGLNGLPPGNLDVISPRKYPTITYSDIRFEWNVGGSQSGGGDGAKGLRFYVGVDNVLNQLPPLGSTATGAGSAIYDYNGRQYYAGARVRF